MKHTFIRLAPILITTLCSTMSITSVAANLDDSLSVTANTSRAAQGSQQQIDKLATETDSLLHAYQQLLQQTDYQQAYNTELKQRLQEQTQEMQDLQQSLADAQVTRLHILPLLREMTAALKQFIELDLPFEKTARLQSVQQLENLLGKSNVSIAEKYRRVMEAWQTESDYSYNIASYRDEVELNQQTISAEFLRIGRTALYVQTLDGQQSAIWQAQASQWQLLPVEFNSTIRQGIRMANKQLPPQLLALPVVAEATP